MKINPLVSVIVPVYNQERYIAATLDSICRQTYHELEIILVDDGSTDATPAILADYAAKDARIRLLHQQNKFAGCARNYGMSEAKGKYYSLLDSDDLFEPDMIELMVAKAESSGADIVVCTCDKFDKPGEYQPMPWQVKQHMLKGVKKDLFTPLKDIPDNIFQFLMGWSWDKLYRADFVKSFGLTFAPTRHGNDGPFVFPSIVAARSISILDERPLVHYRISETQISSKGGLSSAPTVCLDSVNEIYSKIEPFKQCEAMMNSFYRWAAEYISWNATRVCGEARAALFEAIRTSFDSTYHMADKLAKMRQDGVLSQYGAAVVKTCATYESAVAPLISVVLPIFNAESFLRQALDSVLNQAIQNIEIICVNDGSKDNSLEIIKEYEQKDARIRLIDVPNGGYGKAMNLGLFASRGKYFAILEPDDYLPLNAYQTLFDLAETHSLDLVRGKFTRFCTDNEGKQVTTEERDYMHAGQVIRPRDYHEYFYNMSMATWTCLYRMDFLKKHDIDYHESPGASYQDTGFFMQTFGYAERAMLTNEVVYMYRTDNAASSTNTKSGKPHAMQNEFAFIKEKYLSRPERWQNLQQHFLLRRMAAHRWMYNSIAESSVPDYLISLRQELLALKEVCRERFIPVDITHYEQITKSPEFFLCHAGKFPGYEKVLAQLLNPFKGAVVTKYEAAQTVPAVSVIVPVYSGMAYFALMIALLRAQTLRNLEFIFIDDCGQDGSFTLAEMAAQDDPRIKLIRNEKNIGAGLCRNKGIAAATGEYIAFVDADDVIPVDYYENLYAKARETGAKVVKCSRADQYSDGHLKFSTMNDSIAAKLAEGEHVVNAFAWEHTAAIYQREHVINNGARNSDAAQDEDTTFILMTLHNLNHEDVAVIDYPTYYYRKHEQSVTQVKDANYLFEAVKSLKDKIEFILSLPSTPALEKYAADQIENRLHWRYLQAAQSSLISDEQRKAYVEQVSLIISLYCQQRPQHLLFGFSKKIAEGKFDIASFMACQLKRAQQNPSEYAIDAIAPTKELRAFLNDYPRYKAKYLRHRILYWLSVGKSHRKHKEKMRQLKTILSNWRDVIKACSKK